MQQELEKNGGGMSYQIMKGKTPPYSQPIWKVMIKGHLQQYMKRPEILYSQCQ